MNIAIRLERLRHPFPECTTLVLADLSAGLILGTNSTNTLPKERLDRLGQTAECLLCPPAPESALVSSPIHTAIMIDGGALQMFVTSPDGGDVAICCTGSSALDTAALSTGARALLAELDGPE